MWWVLIYPLFEFLIFKYFSVLDYFFFLFLYVKKFIFSLCLKIHYGSEFTLSKIFNFFCSSQIVFDEYILKILSWFFLKYYFNCQIFWHPWILCSQPYFFLGTLLLRQAWTFPVFPQRPRYPLFRLPRPLLVQAGKLVKSFHFIRNLKPAALTTRRRCLLRSRRGKKKKARNDSITGACFPPALAGAFLWSTLRTFRFLIPLARLASDLYPEVLA